MLKRNINEMMISEAVSDFFNRKKAEQNFYFALCTFCTRKETKKKKKKKQEQAIKLESTGALKYLFQHLIRILTLQVALSLHLQVLVDAPLAILQVLSSAMKFCFY